MQDLTPCVQNGGNRVRRRGDEGSVHSVSKSCDPRVVECTSAAHSGYTGYKSVPQNAMSEFMHPSRSCFQPRHLFVHSVGRAVLWTGLAFPCNAPRPCTHGGSE